MYGMKIFLISVVGKSPMIQLHVFVVFLQVVPLKMLVLVLKMTIKTNRIRYWLAVAWIFFPLAGNQSNLSISTKTCHHV